MEELEAKYIKSNEGGCSATVSSASTAVSFKQVGRRCCGGGAGARPRCRPRRRRRGCSPHMAPPPLQPISPAAATWAPLQVAGLWILLGAGIGVACLLAAAHQLLRRGARRVAKTELYARSMKRVNTSVRMVRAKSLARVGTLVRLGSGGRRRDGSSAGSDDAERGSGGDGDGSPATASGKPSKADWQ